MSATRAPKGFERDDWALVWMNVTHDIAKRSACTKAQLGAVIVTTDNRIISSGYNGPPAAYTGTCEHDCPRAQSGDTSSSYDACISIHAELNAIMFCSRADREGATLFVNGVVCISCAKIIANSGIARVVMKVSAGDMHRHPDRSMALLTAAGLAVEVWGAGLTEYVRVFLQTFGGGPFDCHFCHERMPWLEVVHHRDGDHENNDPSNLAPAHGSCHSSHHATGRVVSEATKKKLRVSRPPRKEACPALNCDVVTTVGRLKKHRDQAGH